MSERDLSLEDLSRDLHGARQILRDNAAELATVAAAAVTVLAWAYLAVEDSPYEMGSPQSIIPVCRELLIAMPEAWEFQPSVRSLLAHALRKRYEQHGELGDLTEALTLAEEDHAAEPPDSDDRVDVALNLCSLLDHKWQVTRDADLVDRTLILSEWAVQEAPPGSASLARARNNLGRAQGRRFETTGNLQSLEDAVSTLLLALDEAPEYWTEQGAALSGLGHWLRIQYSATGRRTYLDQSIKVHREAQSAFKVGDPGQRLALTNLATSLLLRGDIPGCESDLAEATALNQAALSLTPVDAPDRAGYLNNLATSIGRQALRQGDPVLLDRAIDLLDEAASLTGVDDGRGLSLANLASYLAHRYRTSHDSVDLERAHEVAQEALAATGGADPNRCLRLGALASVKALAISEGASDDDVIEISATFRAACNAALPFPAAVLPLSHQWCVFAHDHNDIGGAVEAAEISLEALSQIVRTQSAPDDAGPWLAFAQRVTHAAACAFIPSGRLQDAISSLERGRAVVLGDALRRDRADLELVREAGRPDLAEKFEDAALAVRAAVSSARRSSELTSHNLAVAEEANAALAAALEAIRELPDLGDFSRPGAWGTIAEATRTAPIAYASPGPNGGIVLSLSRAGTTAEPRTRYSVAWLPMLTLEAVRTHVTEWLHSHEDREQDRQQWITSTRGLCEWAGEALVGPVLGALGGPERLTLVAGGLLGLVPMHAANWTSPQDGQIRSAIDVVELTLVPSAESRTASQRNAEQDLTGRTVIVEAANITGRSLLPGAFEEAAVIAAIRPSAVTLSKESAGIETVMEAVRGAQTIHFACHADSFPDKPSESRLVLANGSALSLEELAGLDLTQCRLTVLSACETGVIGTDMPDEVVSLASATLLAGAAGVVASLWAAGDLSTSLLMARMYEALEVSGTTPSHALRQAQLWLRDTTNQVKLDYVRSLMDSTGETILLHCEEKLSTLVDGGHGDRRSFEEATSWATYAFWGA
jgi:CHAT domain-containing protein/tetratricopeptide (TPR) repeat protein